nr:hypothetical protein CFP56_69039 [Quercus suber]
MLVVIIAPCTKIMRPSMESRGRLTTFRFRCLLKAKNLYLVDLMVQEWSAPGFGTAQIVSWRSSLVPQQRRYRRCAYPAIALTMLPSAPRPSSEGALFSSGHQGRRYD